MPSGGEPQLEKFVPTINIGYKQEDRALGAVRAFQYVVSKIDALDAKVSEKPPGVKEQTLKVRDEVKKYQKSKEWDSLLRHDWPFTETELVDEDFKKWLKGHCQDDSTYSGHIRALQRFKGMLETDNGEEIDEMGMLVNAVRSKVFEELMILDAFAADLSYTSKALTAIGKLRKYQRPIFLESNDAAALRYLELLTESKIQDLRKQVSGERKAAGGRKGLRDWEIIDAAASPELTKKAIKNSMIDLELITQRYQHATTMPASVRMRASQLCFFIVSMNGFAGRPKEWMTLPKQDYLRQLSEHAEYLAMTDFKTKAKFVVVGKGMFPGTVQALLAFASLPTVDGNDATLLFTPTPMEHKRSHQDGGGSDYLNGSDLVGRGHQMYLSGYPVQTMTILRKKICTRTSGGKVSEDFAVLAYIDTHSEVTALGSYDLTKLRPRELGEKGRHLFQKYCFAPVDYPSIEEVRASGRTADVVMGRSYKCDVNAPLPSPPTSTPIRRKIEQIGDAKSGGVKFKVAGCIHRTHTADWIEPSSSSSSSRGRPISRVLERQTTAASTPPPTKSTGPKITKREDPTPTTPTRDASSGTRRTSGAKMEKPTPLRWDATLKLMAKLPTAGYEDHIIHKIPEHTRRALLQEYDALVGTDTLAPITTEYASILASKTNLETSAVVCFINMAVKGMKRLSKAD